MARQSLDELCAHLGHSFANPDLLVEALAHASANRRAGAGDNQRLEFLGDRVLGLVIADHLLRLYDTAETGAIARQYNTLVRRESLAEVALQIGLGDHLTLSKSERASGGGRKPAILADACEAVIGALYLDGGLDAAANFIHRFWDAMADSVAKAPKDAKTALQEFAQARTQSPPVYAVIDQEGPPHDTRFTVEVRIDGMPPTEGSGRSKRAAEQAAAAALLENLGDADEVAGEPHSS
jgi:ribonuclease-3